MCLVFLIYFLEPKTIFVTFTCQHFLPRCRCYGTHNCEAWGKSYCRKSSTRLTKKIKNIVKALVKNHYGDDFLFWKILIWKPSLYRNSGMKSGIERNTEWWLACPSINIYWITYLIILNFWNSSNINFMYTYHAHFNWGGGLQCIFRFLYVGWWPMLTLESYFN